MSEGRNVTPVLDSYLQALTFVRSIVSYPVHVLAPMAYSTCPADPMSENKFAELR